MEDKTLENFRWMKILLGKDPQEIANELYKEINKQNPDQWKVQKLLEIGQHVVERNKIN